MLDRLVNGMGCAHSETSQTSLLTHAEAVDFLEPHIATSNTPARAGAVCRSAADDLALKNALEQACRELGSHCSYEIQREIQMLRGLP